MLVVTRRTRNISPTRGKLVRNRDEILLFRDHVIGHSAVTLPTVSTTVFFASAGNHVAAAAVVANTATRDVIYDDTIVYSKTTAAPSDLHRPAATLKSRYK